MEDSSRKTIRELIEEKLKERPHSTYELRKLIMETKYKDKNPLNMDWLYKYIKRILDKGNRKGIYKKQRKKNKNNVTICIWSLPEVGGKWQKKN